MGKYYYKNGSEFSPKLRFEDEYERNKATFYLTETVNFKSHYNTELTWEEVGRLIRWLVAAARLHRHSTDRKPSTNNQ